jgi:hypothetical protein
MNRLIIHITNTAILLALIAGIFPAQAVFAERMSSGSYTLESDSVNFAGTRSSSPSYKLEDTAGEIATGDLSSANENRTRWIPAVINDRCCRHNTDTNSNSNTVTGKPERRRFDSSDRHLLQVPFSCERS